MGIRNLGILDNYYSGHIASSRLTDRVICFRVAGENPDVDTASIEDVWETGGVYSYLENAAFLTLVSTSASDAPTLGGLESVTLTGIDENYDYQIATYTLNGVTGVVTTEKWLRVFSFRGEVNNPASADYNTKAQGLITAKDATVTQAAILAGNTASKQSFITVLNGYTGFLENAYTSGGAADDFIMRFATRKNDGIFISGSDIEVTNSSFASVVFDPPTEAITEKTDIKVEAQAQVQNAQVRIAYAVTMIRNDYLQSLAESM
ncbi:MAG: hypothetical protein ACC707_01630 [Thiohalomonadales bacterium]